MLSREAKNSILNQIPTLPPLLDQVMVGTLEGRQRTKKELLDLILKLGRFGDWEDPRVLAMTSSSSSLCSSTKRAWAPTNATEKTTVVCSVDGCISDLNKCRDYHRRQVCEIHSKTPKVMIGGREQRFCQQCSRFHLLVEFDEVKRSCRKRLDGHNLRRRRKPQPEPFTISSGSLLSNHQGIGLLPLFSGPQLFHSATDRIYMWTGAIKTDDDSKVYICLP